MKRFALRARLSLSKGKNIFVHFDTNTALFESKYVLGFSSLVSRKQYRPRTTDNDFNIQIFRHFLPNKNNQTSLKNLLISKKNSC